MQSLQQKFFNAASQGDSKTILHLWCNYRNLINMDMQNEQGDTPLIVACTSYAGLNNPGKKEDLVDTVALLLARGANSTIKHATGNSPLHFAAGKGDHEIVAMLLRHPHEINAPNQNGETPLHRVCHSLCFRYLETNQRIELNPDQLKTLKILLKANANPDVRNKQGKTISDYITQSTKLDLEQKKWLFEFIKNARKQE
jgi:ankyrin repeat protein